MATACADPLYIPSKTGDGDVVLVNVYPDSAPQDAADDRPGEPPARATPSPRRSATRACNVLVGGTTAIYIDFANVLSSKLPLFIGLVVMLSFLLLDDGVPKLRDPAHGGVHEPALHRRRARACWWRSSSGETSAR